MSLNITLVPNIYHPAGGGLDRSSLFLVGLCFLSLLRVFCCFVTPVKWSGLPKASWNRAPRAAISNCSLRDVGLVALLVVCPLLLVFPILERVSGGLVGCLVACLVVCNEERCLFYDFLRDSFLSNFFASRKRKRARHRSEHSTVPRAANEEEGQQTDLLVEGWNLQTWIMNPLHAWMKDDKQRVCIADVLLW